MARKHSNWHGKGAGARRKTAAYSDEARRTWNLKFGPAVAAHAHALDWAADDAGDAAINTPPAGKVQAWLGIDWVDPNYAINYWFNINGEYVPPPNIGTGGRVLRPILLNHGNNVFNWGIGHSAQGWKNAVYVRINGQVAVLKRDEDPSSGTNDDLSKGRNVVLPVA